MLVVVIKLLISSPRDFTCPQSCPTRQVDLRMMIILWQPKSELVVGHHRTLSYHFDNMWKDINYQMSFVILFSGLGFKRWVTEKSHFENNLEKCKDSCGFSTDSINDYILKQKMFVISLFSHLDNVLVKTLNGQWNHQHYLRQSNMCMKTFRHLVTRQEPVWPWPWMIYRMDGWTLSISHQNLLVCRFEGIVCNYFYT